MVNPVCKQTAVFSVTFQTTLKGKLENDLPVANSCPIALRLLSFSSFLNVYRCFSSTLKIKKVPPEAGLKYKYRFRLRNRCFIFYRRVRLKRSVYDVLFFCGWPKPCGHWQFPYACGSHELFFCDAYAVDRFFFYLALY